MSDEHSSVPPCWAADPTGRHRFRFWDGTTWTGHVSDGAEPPATAPGPPPTAALYPEAELTPSHEYEQAQPSAYEQSQYLAEPHDQYAADVGEPVGKRDGSRRAFWTGALIGGLAVAVLGGIAWVTVGGSSDTGVATPATTSTSREKTTTTLESTTTLATSTTVTTVAGRPPAEVQVEVVNASGKEGAAGAMSTTLKAAGYTITGLGNATTQKGTTVACKTGFDAEAAALAQKVGSGATTQPLPNPPPAGAANADCLVTLGS